MRRFLKGAIRFAYRTNSVVSVFKHNDGRFKPTLNLSGFDSNRVHMYPQFHELKKYYLKDFHRYYSYLINEKNQYVFTKLTSFFVFSRLTHYSNVLGMISKGEFISYQSDQPELEEVLDRSKLVIKPIMGIEGLNVYICTKISKSKYSINTRTFTKESLIAFVKSLDNYILEDFVYQHDYLNRIFAKSTNTIRLVTMRDPINHEIFVAWAAQRIGTEKSAPVDNWSAGGISAEIDMKNGLLSVAKYYDHQNKKLVSFEKHPDSNAQISGVAVPHWEKIKRELLLAHKALPSINFIAWDVVVTENGFTVIEVNNTSGVEHIQVHRPLLKDRRIREFFIHHKIIKW